ncbi:hypothetical protein H4Q26_002068 [Puccinia striiformis f. sp. tritici PST-130]|nr:hypothetical protein H4Q26_002068 [Puccinia striiformis f. sp. tritici PST-130]
MDFYTPAPLTRHIAGESFSETGQHSTLPDGLPFQTPCPAYYDAVPNLDGSFSRGRSPQLFITSRPAITQTSSSTQPTLHMSQQQPIVLEPRMFDCAVSLLIWIEKKHKNRKSTWKGIRCQKTCQSSLTPERWTGIPSNHYQTRVLQDLRQDSSDDRRCDQQLPSKAPVVWLYPSKHLLAEDKGQIGG